MLWVDVFHWCIVPAALLVLVRFFFGHLTRLAFPSVFALSYLVLIHIQALNVYRTEFPQPMYLVTVWLTPFLVVIVSKLLLVSARHGPGVMNQTLGRIHFSARDRSVRRHLVFVSIMFVLLPFVLVMDKGPGGIALFFLLSHPGATFDTMALRLGGLESSWHPALTVLYAYSRSLLYPLYTGLLVLLWTRRSISHRHLLIVLTAGFFYCLLTAAKAPLAILLANAALALYFGRRGRIPRPMAACITVAALMLPALLYPLLMSSPHTNFLAFAAERLWRRLTFVPSYTSAVYFDAFTNVYPHLGLRSNRLLALLSGHTYTSTPALIFGNYFASSAHEGGLVNAAYFASFFADWGLPGAFLGSVLVGWLLGWLQVFFDRRHVDMTGTAVRCTALIATVQLCLTNFYSVALGRGLLSIPALLWLSSYFENRQRSSPAGRGIPSNA